MYNILQKYFSSLVFLIKVLIIAGAYYVISDKLLNNDHFSNFLWSERIESLGSTRCIISHFSIIVNRSQLGCLRSKKWQSLVATIKTYLYQDFGSTKSGLSCSVAHYSKQDWRVRCKGGLL